MFIVSALRLQSKLTIILFIHFSSTEFCVRCGSAFSDTVKFCSNCGAPRGGPTQDKARLLAPAVSSAPRLEPAVVKQTAPVVPVVAPLYTGEDKRRANTNPLHYEPLPSSDDPALPSRGPRGQRLSFSVQQAPALPTDPRSSAAPKVNSRGWVIMSISVGLLILVVVLLFVTKVSSPHDIRILILRY